MAREGGQRMAALFRRSEQHRIPAPICHAPQVAMAPHLTPQVAEESILMGPTLTTYQDVLAEAENPTPVAGSTICRPFHPREEPRALTGLRGSGRLPAMGIPTAISPNLAGAIPGYLHTIFQYRQEVLFL